MDTNALHVLKTRRSVREFKSDPIPEAVLEDIVDCARLAPTAMNTQPWEFVVVTEPELRHRIAEATDHGKHIAVAPACVLVFCRDGAYYLEDGCAATENIMLAAHAHGLGSCWIAGDKKAYAGCVRDIVGAPAECRLVSLIPIGYPAVVPAPTKRPLADVLHWERF